MNITQKEMDDINNVQLNLFKEFIKVCNKLNLKYYMVHGSLLGAVKYKGFFPYDDDIDVAMPRKDYDIFIKQGQKHLSKNIFIQCNKTEKDYPLVFTKLRDSNTTFIQKNYEGYNINQGIYIDIFPIDFYPENINNITKIKEKVYSIRVNSRMKNIKRTLKQKIFVTISKIIYPNWYKTIYKLDNLYKNYNNEFYCIVHGGKNTEIKIPFNIFGNGQKLEFENIEINVPEKYKEYLQIIYGDYNNYNPSAKYMVSKDLVTISAKKVDINKSYKEYLNK